MNIRAEVRLGVPGKSAYQSYLEHTTDDPPLKENEWITKFTTGQDKRIDSLENETLEIREDYGYYAADFKSLFRSHLQ